MNWQLVQDVSSAILFLSGGLLCMFGGLGILRFPDMLSRIHAATKPQILGLILVLAGTTIQLWNFAALGMLILIGLFQIMTAPVAGHMLARASYRTDQVQEKLLIKDDLSVALNKQDAEE